MSSSHFPTVGIGKQKMLLILGLLTAAMATLAFLVSVNALLEKTLPLRLANAGLGVIAWAMTFAMGVNLSA